ncbi:hypothetical protein [Thiothrix lacustris]|uniref:hypothetical protein n=1 Tax=Thiothrix lacustris TaxID=525917 RepID=UPI00048CA985|nr:hypothetical protein [Thiothrix lacustris]
MNTEMLYALRDVAGVPSHPVLFLILGVLTFALHILTVQVMLGASGLVIWGALSKDAYKRQLAQAMLGTAKIAVSVAVVLGVAPLLFVQVIYDPFWYTSNVLSATWVIGFIVILTVGYLLMYFFYAKNHHLATQKTVCPGSMILSLALMLVVGFIMHVLVVQMLSPDQWMQWYAPNGEIDASGRGLHAYNLWRFAFFISLSVLVIGSWLLAYRHYISHRTDVDSGYLQWLKGLAGALSLAGGILAIGFGIGWMLTLPESQASFGFSPWVWLAALMIALTAVMPKLMGNKVNAPLFGYGLFGLAAVALILVAVAREMLRWNILFGDFGYNALDYAVNMDWYSTLLFFGTFLIIGGTVLAYFLTVAWQAGQTDGVYTPSPAVTRLGNLSIILITLWIIHFFVLGLWVWLG